MTSFWKRWRLWLLLAGFIVLSFALYGNSLAGQFVYDDKFFSISLQLHLPASFFRIWIRPLAPFLYSAAVFRPLTATTWLLNSTLFGPSPLSFHIVNVLLNGIACWVLLIFVEKVFRNGPLALVTALLFAFLPIHTEAVAYIKSRDEILLLIMVLLGWLAFARAVETNGRSRRLWSIVTGLLVFAAGASKEFGLIAPLLYGVWALVFKKNRSMRKLFWLFLPSAVAIVIFLILRTIAFGTLVPQSEDLYFGVNPLGFMDQRFAVWTGFEIAFLSIAKPFVPWNLSATYSYNHLPIIGGPQSWMAFAGIAGLAVLLLLVVIPKAAKSPLGIGALLFLVLYLPFSKFLFVGNIDLFAEHWLYGPSAGLSLIAAWFIERLLRWSRLVTCTALAALFIVYAMILIPRNAVWHSDETLAESMVRDAPDGVQGYGILGVFRIQEGRIDEARQLLQTGLHITTLHPPLLYLLAYIDMSERNFPQAEQAITTAERFRSDYTSLMLRSLLLAREGRFAESLAMARTQGKNFEVLPDMRMIFAVDLYRLGQTKEARQYFNWDVNTDRPMTTEQKIQFIEEF